MHLVFPNGAGSRTRTDTSITRGILSPLRLPFRHTRYHRYAILEGSITEQPPLFLLLTVFVGDVSGFASLSFVSSD